MYSNAEVAVVAFLRTLRRPGGVVAYPSPCTLSACLLCCWAQKNVDSDELEAEDWRLSSLVLTPLTPAILPPPLSPETVPPYARPNGVIAQYARCIVVFRGRRCGVFPDWYISVALSYYVLG